MAKRGRSKHVAMEHFTLFLPSALLSEIRAEVENSGGTVAEKIRFYIESGRHWRDKYAEKLTEVVLSEALADVIEHDPGYLEREKARRRSPPSPKSDPAPKPPSRKAFSGLRGNPLPPRKS